MADARRAGRARGRVDPRRYLSDAYIRVPRQSKRTTYHHGNLRQALVDAAVALIAERGPHGFNVREVARRAGVSSGAPYRHFDDRDALLTAIAIEGTQRMRALMDEERARADADPLAQFRAMGVAYVKFAITHPCHFRVMTMPEFAAPDAGGALHAEVAAHQEALRTMIEASQRAGSVYGGNPDVIALAAECLVYGLARMFVDGQLPRVGVGAEQAEAIAVALTGVLGHGLLPRPDDPGSADCEP